MLEGARVRRVVTAGARLVALRGMLSGSGGDRDRAGLQLEIEARRIPEADRRRACGEQAGGAHDVSGVSARSEAWHFVPTLLRNVTPGRHSQPPPMLFAHTPRVRAVADVADDHGVLERVVDDAHVLEGAVGPESP